MVRNIYQLSYWERVSFFEGYQVAILGSGIVGLSAALHLKAKDPGLRILIIERGPLPAGASTRNAGFACFGSMTELLDDLQRTDDHSVWALVERRFRGLQRLRERLGDGHIRYEPLGGYEIFRQDEKQLYQHCLDAMPEFNRRLRSLTGRSDTFQIADDRLASFGFKGINHMILNAAEGQIHTGEMMKGLLKLAREKDIDIINGLEIQHIRHDRHGVYLTTKDDWDLSFEKVLIATNGFTHRFFPELDVVPARNQLLITKPIPGLPFKGSFHYDKGYYYFRNIDGRILLGGGRNLTPEREQTDVFGTTSLIRESLLGLLRNVILPQHTIKIDGWWSGILGVGERKSPILEAIGPNLALAVRLGGMGVAIGTLVGEEGAELLLENKIAAA